MSTFKSAFALAVLGLVLAGGAILTPHAATAAAPVAGTVVSTDGDSTRPQQPSTDDEPAVQVAGLPR